MATITISRQFGSHGDTVAQLLCDRLGYRYFDKHLVMGLAVQAGLPVEKVASVLAADQEPAQFQEMRNICILGVMFLSRILSGVAGGMITVAQAYIADIANENNRTMGMGLIGAAFGLGFIVGPVMGGVLSQWGYAVPAYTVDGLALVSLVSILVLLPESLTAERKAELSRQAQRGRIDLTAMFKKLGKPRIGPLLTTRLFVSLAGALFMALFTLWAKERLGLDAKTTSYLMAYTGLLSIVAQVGLIGPLTKRYSQANLIAVSVVVLGVALLVWAFTSNVPVLLVVLIPYSFTTGVLNTVINSGVTWAVPPHEMGDALGASSAFESLSRVIAPTLGGWLLAVVGSWAPGVLGAVIMAFLAVFTWHRLIRHPDPPLAEPVLLEQEKPEALLPATAG